MAKYVTIQSLEGTITYELAGFGERLGARIIDTLIIIIPNSIVPFIAGWLYWALQQSAKDQATVGQKALKIKLIDKNGEKVGFGQATGRFFGNFLNIITLFVGFFMMFFNNGNQCLHDYLAGTFVVKETPINMEDDLTVHLLDD